MWGLIIDLPCLPPGSTHSAGWSGTHLASKSVAMTAAIGPVTAFHFALGSPASADTLTLSSTFGHAMMIPLLS